MATGDDSGGKVHVAIGREQSNSKIGDEKWLLVMISRRECMHRKRNRAILKSVMNIWPLMIISGRGCMDIMQSEHIIIIMMSMTL